MPQDEFSGRQGNAAGRKIAEEVALHLDLTLSKGSNECNYFEKLSVIKSAKHTNTDFGVTKTMLGRIEQIILAKQTEENGPFNLYLVPSSKIEPYGRKTRSKGSTAGKVINFRVSKVIKLGTYMGEINII